MPWSFWALRQALNSDVWIELLLLEWTPGEDAYYPALRLVQTVEGLGSVYSLGLRVRKVCCLGCRVYVEALGSVGLFAWGVGSLGVSGLGFVGSAARALGSLVSGMVAAHCNTQHSVSVLDFPMTRAYELQ